MMSHRPYPISLAELENWRQRNGTTSDEARKRLAQYLILEAIAGAPDLASALIFKGGNALRFVYGSRRTTLDLDFTAISGFSDDPDTIRLLLNSALARIVPQFNVPMRCQRVHRNPKRQDATRPTYSIKVGYQFPGDPYFADYLSTDRLVSTTVEVEISLNDVVCATRDKPPGEVPVGEVRVRVCAIEDIIAEKLRALLQQPIRNRNRKQDVYDIARIMLLQGASLDLEKIGDYLLRKSKARDVCVSKTAFNDDVMQRASFEYETLFSQLDPDFIPFSRAWMQVLSLVNKLPIPS